jgi:hypothetical protein
MINKIKPIFFTSVSKETHGEQALRAPQLHHRSSALLLPQWC